MPTIITGQRATAATNTILAARRVIDMDDKIYLLEPDKAPLSLLASAVSKKAVINPEYKELEDELIPHSDRINYSTGYATNATELTVDNGGYFPANSLWIVQRTKEVVLATSVSSDVVTVTRGWGGTTQATLVDNDQLTCLGGAALEGTTAESSKTTKATSNTNYCQIFRWPFEITNTEIASELYGGADLPYQTKKAGIEFAKRVDLAFFFGEASEVTSGTTPRRSTGGLNEWISTNTKDMGGSFNYNTFVEFSEDLFRYGAKDKVAFVSRGIASAITLAAMGHMELGQKEDTFGMSVSRLVTPHGRLRVVTHDLLEGDVFGGYGFIVDLDNIGYRFLRGRDVKLMQNIQANDADSRKDEYLGEIGMFRALEKTHGLITNGG